MFKKLKFNKKINKLINVDMQNCVEVKKKKKKVKCL